MTSTNLYAPAGSLTEAPARDIMADLEDLAALELGPEYVLAFVPPDVYGRLRDRLTQLGWWELLTVADFETGNHAPDDWTLDAPRDTPAASLAAWVREILGHPVELEAGTWELRPGGTFARWHTEPLFWVRRDT